MTVILLSMDRILVKDTVHIPDTSSSAMDPSSCSGSMVRSTDRQTQTDTQTLT